MAESNVDVDSRLAEIEHRLENNLDKRRFAEGELQEAKRNLASKRALLQTILEEEGKLRATIGELQKLSEALDG